MAISISSCLSSSSSPPPPPPRPLPSKKRPTLTPRSPSKEAGWGTRCVATAACIIIGSSTAGFAAGDGRVLAGDLKVDVEGSEGKVVRWSDKRKCPPWHLNSLENIMPEDLPRPLTGRRSNGLVAYKRAPMVGGAPIQYRSSCYSL